MSVYRQDGRCQKVVLVVRSCTGKNVIKIMKLYYPLYCFNVRKEYKIKTKSNNKINHKELKAITWRLCDVECSLYDNVLQDNQILFI